MAQHVILLKCDSPNGAEYTSVSAGARVYPVIDGFVLVDVRPALLAEMFIPNPNLGVSDGVREDNRKTIPNPVFDSHADAELDARQIVQLRVYSPQLMSYAPIYRPATKAERDAWMAEPDNVARFEGKPPKEAKTAAAVAAEQALDKSLAKAADKTPVK